LPFEDLRTFIEKLRNEKELVDIKDSVDWNLEVGATTKRSFDLKGPALLFEKVKDYKTHRVVSGLLGPSKPIPSRYALALETSRNTTTSELIEEFIKRQKNPIKPQIVKKGPCKENIYHDKKVDLLKFPFPIIHAGDGGRYIAWHTNITKDPETGWVNWGIYRMMIVNKTITTVSYGPNRHIKNHFEKYKERGENMPMATVIGTDPVITIASGTSVETNFNEVDLAGGLRKKPVKLIKCETIDLEVPATAEIVLEGEVSTQKTLEEGPFGEYHGYMGTKTTAPTYHVKCITHRNNPIMTTSNMSTPIHDSSILSAISSPAAVLTLLRNLGYQAKAISTLFLPNLYVLSCKKTHNYTAQHIAYAIWGASRGRVCTHLIVVDEDINVNDPYQVLWAFCTRVDPRRDIFIAPHVAFPQLTPFPEDDIKKGIGTFVCYDADFPHYWTKDQKKRPLSFKDSYPENIQKKAIKKMNKLNLNND
jgi:4-hydroxy-3-polyprenylbenzoate decarboxylase